MQRINELTKLNALFREHLKARDEAEERLPELQQSAQGVLNRLYELEAKRQPATENGQDRDPFE